MPEALETHVAAVLEGVSRTRRHLVGVSGGRDSVALLHALVAAGFRKLTVCHLDHRLRGAAGRADARFVERLAARRGVDFAGGSTDVAAIARSGSMSVEAAGREARYAFFVRVARAARCRTLFLGHHADDRVETFLFNLLRGAGPGGLSGMRMTTIRSIEGRQLTILRPMLGVWRREIDEYVSRHRLRFREDASNANRELQRNNLRHHILPGLTRDFGRDVRPALWRTAELLAAEDDWIRGRLEPLPGKTLPAKTVARLHPAEQRRVIHSWLKALAVPDAGFAEVERVRSLLSGGSPARVNLPGGRFARRRAGTLFLEPDPPGL